MRMIVLLGTMFAAGGLLDGHAWSQDQSPALDLPPLLDGAESAEAAVKAYARASLAADADAALRLFDPGTRDLFVPEILYMQVVWESRSLKRAAFGKAQQIGFSFQFADRDLVRLESNKIQSRRIIDADHIAFTVQSTQKNYDDGEVDTVVQQILAVRQKGKWFVFRPLGLMLVYLLDPINTLDYEEAEEPPKQVTPIIESIPAPAEAKGTADYTLKYNVPIERIHTALKAVAAKEQAKLSATHAGQAHRAFRAVFHKLVRGDVKDRAAFDTLMSPIEQIFEKATNLELVETAIIELEKATRASRH